jgi:hypothetical protein
MVAAVLTTFLPTVADSGAAQAGAGAAPCGTFDLKGDVALSSLMSLSDGHLKKMAEAFLILRDTEAGRSADWRRLRGPLAALARNNVPALNWFALPDGSYWSVQHGKEAANLSPRAYFSKLLAGQTVIGDLVVSKATGKPVAIVAVPVFGAGGVITGVLGASVYLDKLGEIIDREMDLDETMIFYSFDHSSLVALDWDPHLIFVQPRESGEADLARAFEEMLGKERGLVCYRFRGKQRTVMFRKSPVTHWWYAFGIIPEGRETTQPLQQSP